MNTPSWSSLIIWLSDLVDDTYGMMGSTTPLLMIHDFYHLFEWLSAYIFNTTSGDNRGLYLLMFALFLV